MCMNTRVNNILRSFILILLMSGIFSSCLQEDIISPDYPDNSTSSTLSFISDPMERYKVTTRGSYIKDDAEKKINNIHVFFFDERGEYLKGGYLSGYPDARQEGGYYVLGEGVTSLKIDEDLLPEGTSKAIIYAVANVDQFMFSELEDGLPKNVTNLFDLENMDYSLGENISLGIPQNGIPMVSKVEMDFTKQTKEHIVELKSLMSRIDVNIKLESDITDRNYPALTLVEWTAKNIPMKGSFSEITDNSQTGEKWGQETWTKSITTPLQQIIYNKNGEIALSFYMFENVQNAEWKKDDGEEWQVESPTGLPSDLYPEEIENPDFAYQKQRYKPYLANKNAAAVELHAFYSTYNETGSGTSTYEVRYTLYLGANHTDDFKVKRNHKYENNITIKGLTQVGTNPNHITFDARVNVKDQDNEFYIAMLRERNHDAHFCVTPMDVYLFKDNEQSGVNPTMEVILGEVTAGTETPTDVPDWIRMEKICAADMKEGTVTLSGFTEYVKGASGTGTHLAKHQPWSAGNGKRAFFTKDLLTSLNEKGQKVTIESTRDRVYFYIDENLELQDRSAIVTLIYKENGTEVKRRTIKIEQTHLLPVKLRDNKGTIYMERYEEYLDHYDPLDEHRTDQIYDGLPWAEYNSTLWNKNIDRLYKSQWGSDLYDYFDQPYLVINDGLAYTSFIIYLSGNQSVMTMNDKPLSAIQYCHNKNKRNDNGVISSEYGKTLITNYYYQRSNSSKWFLPGIRQMEDALTQYYTTFMEFQEDYYWSCSAGEAEGQTSGQSPTQARATKVNPNYNPNDSNDHLYIESGGQEPKYPQSGRADRTEILRIRAFRNDLNP